MNTFENYSNFPSLGTFLYHLGSTDYYQLIRKEKNSGSVWLYCWNLRTTKVDKFRLEAVFSKNTHILSFGVLAETDLVYSELIFC